MEWKRNEKKKLSKIDIINYVVVAALAHIPTGIQLHIPLKHNM